MDDHGRFVFENYVGGLPFVDEEGFVEKINAVINRHQIDLIVPAHDAVVLKLAECRNFIEAIVVTSPVETCRIARSKRHTYKSLSDIVATPQIYDVSCISDFPVFLKPDVGQGSKGAAVAYTQDDVDFRMKQEAGLLVSEYLPGPEYTVDCFTDRNGCLLFAAGRERLRISNGISVRSKELHDTRFLQNAEAINSSMQFRGAWFFQLKERENGELVLLEVAPRIAGTMALFRADGVNFAQLSLFDALGFDVSVLRNNLNIEIDRALFARYLTEYKYKNLYVDFDDTLIVNGAVNSMMIALLYQARAQRKRITLLTRHTKDIYESLAAFAISKTLFDEIRVLEMSEKKSDCIDGESSIFIDDSFAERKEVADCVGIPVFSPDAIESLMLWRG